MFFRKTKKMAVGILLAIFVFSSFTEFIFSAEPAQAQLGVAVVADAVKQADDIFATIKNGLKIAVLNAAQQAVGYFLRKVAYDSAVWLASGGKGQSPFAHTNGVGDYLKNVGNDAAGAAIDSLGKGFGLDLCKIPDVKIDLALRIGLHYNYGAEPPKPKCNLTTFASNWTAAGKSIYQGDVDPSKAFAASFKVDDTDLGVNIKTTEKIDRLFLQQTDDAKANRAEGGGFKAVTGLIDNRIKTPSPVIADEMKANAPNKQNAKSEAQIGAAMGAGAYEIIPSTLSIFLNTLSSQMLKNFKENGMLPFGVGCIQVPGVTNGKCPGASVGQNPNSAGTELTGRAAAEAVFSEFLTPKLNSVNDYDILGQLSSCESRGLYNCRADQSLVQAIQEAKHGDPVTIAQAIQKGWLHGSGKLIPPSNVSMNTDAHCFDKNNYCYSNVAVLRQLGILPIGFEIAAKNSDPDHPATLEEVVKRFYDCSYQKDVQGNVVGVNYDPTNFPYCHLIDPNWVIKLDQTRCDALGYGTTPVGSEVPDRLQECVDLKTCVGRDSTGNCLGYGNCVREKNVWKFDADKCDAQYASCRSFTNSQGQQLSYLYRTLDTGTCDQGNVGCTAYSLNQNANGWTDLQGGNNSIYLNKQVSSCDASAAGCSAFRLGNSLAYLKKAPDYLNCYDADLNSPGINWPQTLSDIIKMNPKAECKDYTQVCIASEVGCSLFKNVDDADAPAIPGKFSPAQVVNNSVTAWNDQCDARCVGYSAYQEMPTTYSAGNPVAYIIPPSKYNNNQSGTECSAQDDGCTSFTNMESTENGGEKVENFTLLRNCIKPDDTKQKNFYTYEGSKVGGYQLQVYTLQKDTDGSPLAVFKDKAESDYANKYKCNESLYKNKIADPDCRQFNDDQGNVYYELLPNTVAVSPDCSQYRLNGVELAGAEQCFGNGQFKDGACYYYGLPGGVENNAGASKTCSAQMVSCRAYKGNHGNNIKSISLNASSSDPIDTFETVASVSAQNGWSVINGTINQSNESTHAGEHSLELISTNSLAGYAQMSKEFPALTDEVDQASAQSYNLSFWAKGTGLNVEVSMTGDNNQTAASAGIFSANSNWQVFKFNIKLPASNSSTINAIIFKLQSSGSLFLDNVHLTKVSDFIYLVKDSLKVDPICDDDPSDNLPGAALGCTAYSGPKNSLGDTLYYLTNFSYLCRDGAIGCTAFKDTFNKITDTGPRAYNVFLPVASGGVKAVAKIGNDSYSCQVEQGKFGCYVNIKGHTIEEIVVGKVNNAAPPVPDDSTYLVPADSTDSSTIYLVADGSSNSACNAVDVGCTNVGKQTVTPAGVKYVTTTIKIDPNQFESGVDASGNSQSGILCQKEAVGCDEYSSSKGTAYFKNPALTGNKICSFQSFVDPISNQSKSGWFWKGVSVCGTASTPAVIAQPTKYCTADTDCSNNNICLPDLKDKQPCYPDYQKNGNYFDLWSFGDTNKYQNFVGECPAEQDTCTELVDHADKNQTYYLLDNNKLSEGDCAGQVSQKAGCALFDQTDNPNKTYNTAATYALSDSAVSNTQTDIFKVTKVKPDTSGSLDANRIISVKRDRECAEWLQCKASTDRWDDKQNKFISQCSAVGLCDKLPSASNPNGQAANCAEFITGQSDYSNKVLTEDIYTTRDVSWKGRDLVGLSILGSYPIEELWQFNIAKPSVDPDWRLLKLIPCGSDLSKCAGGISQYSCASPTSTYACGAQNQGICVNGLCMQDNSGNASNITVSGIGQGCRAYPEKDSPFPNVAFNNTQNFAKLNKCFESGDTVLNPADNTAYKCECDYIKATFGNKTVVKYFSQYSDSALQNTYAGNNGICMGGSQDGVTCPAPAKDANGNSVPGICETSGGVCQLKDKKTQNFYGWKGFCMEYDKSRILGGTKDNPQYACLSWLPLDLVEGSTDISNNHPESAAMLPEGTKYCVASNLYRSNLTGFDTCFDPDGINTDDNCNTSAILDDGLFADGDQGPHTICGPGFHHEGKSTSQETSYCAHDPDWCIVHCVPNKTKDYKVYYDLVDGAWYSNLVNYFKDRQIGCQAYVQFDSLGNKLSPWTDRIWQYNKSVFKKLDVSAIAAPYQDKVNYAWDAISPPFAFASDNKAQGNASSLLLLQSCMAGSGIFDQPLSNSSCAPGSNLQKYNNLASNNLAYDHWSFGSYSSCSNDTVCNINTVCANHNNNNTCQFKCKKTDQNGVVTGDDTKCKNAFGQNSVCDLSVNACTSTTTPKVSLDCNSSGNSSNCENNGFVCGGSCSFGGVVSSTISCSSDASCYQNSCVGDSVKECLPKNQAAKAPTNDKSLVDKVKESLSLLLQIYAKVPFSSIKIFSNDKDQFYRPPTTTDKLTIGNKDLDITATVTNYDGDAHDPSKKVPQVHPVGDCDTKGVCQEIYQDGFNINGKWPASETDDVIIDTKPFEANFSFFYNADSNHMPVKKIIVDPDTGVPSDLQTSNGNFWNQRGYFIGGMCKGGVCNGSVVPCQKDIECSGKLLPECTTDETKAPSFGYILNKTCDLHPYVAKFYYNCKGAAEDPKSGIWNPTCDVLTGAQKKKWDDAKLGGCCVYQPKVQVLDNWGWCNGKCVGGADGTDGCHDAGQSGGSDICYNKVQSKTLDQHANILFKAKVIVPANKIE